MSGWNETAWFSILTGTAEKSAAVLAAAWLVAALLRRHSAAVRHLVWTAAFAALLALPYLSAALPALRFPLAGALFPSATVVFTDTATAPVDAGAPGGRASSGAASTTHAARWRPDVPMWLMLLWAAGTAIATFRMAVAYAMAWHLRRSARPFPMRDLCATLAHTLGLRHPVDLLQTEPGSMPMTFGLRRAAILMPADAVEWSEGRQRVVLLHELAHVRRYEAAWHFLAHIALAFYWWNPLTWMAWREFLKERERAADDLVLNAGARASEYAIHLLDVARTMQALRAVARAGAAIARRSQIEGRLLAILDSRTDQTAPGHATVWAAAVMAALMILPLAAVRAQDGQPQTMPADIDAAIRVARSQKNYESLESAAQAATQARKYEEAQKLLDAALSIRGETAGEQSVEYGVGLLKLADLEQKQNPKSEGDLYARAARILGDRPEAARALIQLGLVAVTKKDLGQAFELFQHAQLINPAQAGVALMWMAVVRQREKNVEEAERLYQSALAANDGKPVDAAVIMRVYGQFVRAQGRGDEAAGLEARANALQTASGKEGTPPAAGVYRVGKGIGPPSLEHKVEPEYSEEARIALLQGTVVAQVVIGIDGLAHDARILRGLGLGLDENALEAIGRWQFKPGMKDGQPVAVAATIEVNYKLL